MNLENNRGKSVTVKLLVILYSIPLFIRLLPEILAWPYPLGFDTVTYYIPKMVKGTYLKMSIPSLMKTTSLYYILETILYRIYPDPVLIIKILGPILYATMITLIGLYAYKRVGFDWRWTIVCVAVASLSLIGLRLAWDLYRNMLGFIFAFATLITITSKNKNIRYISMILGFLTVWSHELATVYLLFTLTILLIIKLFRNSDLDLSILSTLTISGGLFLYQRINPAENRLIIPLSMIGVSNGINNFILGLEFLAYTSIILIILLIPGLKKLFKDNILTIWTIFTVTLFLLPLIGIYTIPLERIILALILPIPIYVTIGLKYPIEEIGKRGLAYPIIGLTIISMISLPYLVTTPYSPTIYTKIYYYDINKDIFYWIPTAYLENTVSLNSVDELKSVAEYALNSVPDGSVLIVPAQFHWIISMEHNSSNINIRFIREINLWNKNLYNNEFNSGSYFIWWVNGSGWYGLQYLSKNFIEVYRVGEFALYYIA